MTAVLYHLRDMGQTMVLALPLWLVARCLWLLWRKQSPRWRHELLLGLFCVYLLGLASQTLLLYGNFDPIFTDWAQVVQRWESRRGINLTPFATIRSMLAFGGTGQKLINLAGNVLIFVPLGVLPPLLWRKWRHLWAALLLSLSTSCIIEFLQLFLGRSVDVDDLLLNVLGGLTGYILAWLALKLFKKV